MKNYINKEYFKPILHTFYNEAKSLYRCGYLQGPFIPYTMPRYGESNPKIFYLGRDTYYWTPASELYAENESEETRIDHYLEENCKCVDVDKMLEWKNNAGSFWTMVAKLHLQIRTGRYYPDITAISEREKRLLEEIGYGNMYSIETPDTLTNKGEWTDIADVEQYSQLRAVACGFERLSAIVEAYEPDYIFIFSWTDKADFFDGLNVKFHNPLYEDNFRSVFTINSSKTKIIWSSHPRRFSFLGTNIEEMCGYLAETYKGL